VMCLAGGWGLDVASVRYAPVGFGSHHWDVRDAAGERYFVTVDDLDVKGWLGDDRDSAFAGLQVAFDAAVALHRDGRLSFVVAPIPAIGGETVLRLEPRYGVALFPFVDVSGGSVMEHTPGERAHVVRLLADLHAATPVAAGIARRRHLDLPHRRRLEAALDDPDRPWTGGPLSEPVRDLLAGHAPALRQRLLTFDRLAAELAVAERDVVITHGEPHGGNLPRAGDQLVLVDWDTVGLAPPERDLWMVGDDAEALALYAEITGRQVDPRAIELYRLRWALDDISSFTNQLRSPHARTADAEKAWKGLQLYLRSEG